MTALLESKINVIRNFKGYNFPEAMNEKDINGVFENINKIVELMNYEKIYIRDLSEIEKLVYLENNIINKFMMNNDYSILLKGEDSVDVLVNGEDHINIVSKRKDLMIEKSFEECMEIEEELDKHFTFAFDEKFGYLTSNICNVGNGVLPQVRFILPGMGNCYNMVSQINYFKTLGINLIPEYRLNSNSPSYIFTMIPDRCIGADEKFYVEKIKEAAKTILFIEKNAKNKFYEENIIELENRVKRSYGILLNARIITEEEMLGSISNIILGVETGVLPPKDIGKWELKDYNEILNSFRDGHIEFEKGKILEKRTLNILRANNARKFIKEVF